MIMVEEILVHIYGRGSSGSYLSIIKCQFMIIVEEALVHIYPLLNASL
jgi:hypothetical protein